MFGSCSSLANTGKFYIGLIVNCPQTNTPITLGCFNFRIYNMQDIINQAKANASFINSRNAAIAKFNQEVTHAHNGGLFKIDPSFLVYLDMLVTKQMFNCVIIDTQNMPIQIADCTTFYETCFNIYNNACNSLHYSIQQLKKVRTVPQLVKMGE